MSSTEPLSSADSSTLSVTLDLIENALPPMTATCGQPAASDVPGLTPPDDVAASPTPTPQSTLEAPAHDLSPLPPSLLDANQAAQLMSISKRHLLRLDSMEQVPAPIRLGRSVRWSRVELQAWIQHGCPPRKRWSPIWDGLRKRA